jgi:hypothetical protein
MVYDWFLMRCNNALLSTPIIAAQCRDPVIIQQVNKYETEIDIRIKQIVNIIPSGGGGGDGGNGSNSGNDTNKTRSGGNKTPLADPYLGNPTLPECTAPLPEPNPPSCPDDQQDCETLVPPTTNENPPPEDRLDNGRGDDDNNGNGGKNEDNDNN